MSLAQHVSAIEGVDRQELEIEPTLVVRRVLSYDAFPPPVEDQADHIPAYVISTAQRVVQVVITVLVCWLASGIVFGFGSQTLTSANFTYSTAVQ